MTDTSPVLTENPCIEVSINSNCNESADTFQVQLQYTEGMCGRNQTEFTQSTDHYSLGEDYKQCVPLTEPGKFCYSAQVYHNGVVVGSTEPQQLILLLCNISSLNFKGVIITTSMRELIPGEEVAHNTILVLQCDVGYIPANGSEFLNLTLQCVNGTVIPLSAHRCNQQVIFSYVYTVLSYMYLYSYTLLDLL